MNIDLDLLRNVQFLVGFLALIFTTAAGVMLWFHRRVKAIAEAVHAEGSASWHGLGQRLDAVEEDVEKVAHDVRNVRAQNDALGRRLDKMEASISMLARKEDVALLSRDLAKFQGEVGAEIRRNSGMIHTMYEALVRASSDKR